MYSNSIFVAIPLEVLSLNVKFSFGRNGNNIVNKLTIERESEWEMFTAHLLWRFKFVVNWMLWIFLLQQELHRIARAKYWKIVYTSSAFKTWFPLRNTYFAHTNTRCIYPPMGFPGLFSNLYISTAKYHIYFQTANTIPIKYYFQLCCTYSKCAMSAYFNITRKRGQFY